MVKVKSIAAGHISREMRRQSAQHEKIHLDDNTVDEGNVGTYLLPQHGNYFNFCLSQIISPFCSCFSVSNCFSTSRAVTRECIFICSCSALHER